ncbi:methionyl-tRNA formyltransferase [Pelagibacterales bacterium SAG-MED29]|nr:methionyl-tRNA formyltransferase [Pelagibacterales bacterium SAG-MED29]
MSQKIVFMGTPEFSVPTLESLVNSDHKVLAVYSQPASKANRGQKIIPSRVEVFAKENSLNLRTPDSLDNDQEYNYLKKLEPDIVVVIAYGKIIPKKFLNLSKYGFVNVHASLLPKWRGAAPIQRSIMNLDNETGISIMKIVEELDAGPVMHQDKIQINENVDSLTLSKVLSKLGAKSIINAIDEIVKGKARFQEQNHSKATYAKKILKNEGRINWSQSAKKILAKINGLNPNPGAWFEYKNERFKVWKAEIVDKNSDAGKTVDDQLTIACNEQSIKILEIQKEGKSRQLASQFLLGNEIKEDTNIY